MDADANKGWETRTHSTFALRFYQPPLESVGLRGPIAPTVTIVRLLIVCLGRVGEICAPGPIRPILPVKYQLTRHWAHV